MSDTIAHAERIDLAEDWKIGLTRQDDDSWLIAFADAAGTARPVLVPALSVEAISSDQIVRNLKLRPAGASGAIVAEGWVEFATHARISVLTPEGALRIQHRFADAPAVLADVGPRGGFLTDMGHGANVEVVKQGASGWLLVFYEGGAEGPAAPESLISLEVIDRDGNISTFAAEKTSDPSALVVNTVDANPVRLRVCWSHGDHAHRREFDLPSD